MHCFPAHWKTFYFHYWSRNNRVKYFIIINIMIVKIFVSCLLFLHKRCRWKMVTVTNLWHPCILQKVPEVFQSQAVSPCQQVFCRAWCHFIRNVCFFFFLVCLCSYKTETRGIISMNTVIMFQMQWISNI